MRASFLRARDPGFSAAYRALLADREERVDSAESAARTILAEVRADGFAAVASFSERFDGVSISPQTVRVPEAEIARAYDACPKELIAALDLAAARIMDFHERARPEDRRWSDAFGVSLGWRWTPVDRAGLYAPGGLAAYPSSVLMNALPARAAGVKDLVMATPPGRAGDNPAILAAAKIAGVSEVYRVGGAQAIAALAYGAQPIPACDVIVGPGNAYVAAAKKLAFGDVGVDSVAGPSEVFILADASVPADWLAADLLAQAEHDETAQSVLFTNDPALAEAVVRAVEADIADGRAGPAAAVSWPAHGAIILVERLEDAIPLIDLAAPEHVQIATEEAERLGGMVRHAGALFLGAHAPEALGDYIAGPNHVLPTGRRARFASGLSTLTFMKRTTIIAAGAHGVGAIGPAAAMLADAEGLPAHARSIRLRLP